MNHLDQTFGAEFECYVPEGQTGESLARALSARLRQDVRWLGYTHAPCPTWKVVSDGSLNSPRGVEVVSPKLSGEAGLRQVEDVCRALNDFGCSVSKSCGFHVHVGVDVPGHVETGRNVPLHFFKNLARLYALYEPVIDAMMPRSRRGNGNQWARSMTMMDRPALDRATTFSSVWTAVARGGSFDPRYHKVNYDCYGTWLAHGENAGRTTRAHKTVEFRQHSGTTDPVKATRWISLCLRMALKAREQNLQLGEAVGSAVTNQARRGSKAWQVGEMLLRPEGVTGPEIMAALNWPSVSIPAQARACGLQFRTARMGRVVRYFAVTTTPSVSRADVSVNGFCSFIDASGDERAFIEQRTRDLTGPVEWAA